MRSVIVYRELPPELLWAIHSTGFIYIYGVSCMDPFSDSLLSTSLETDHPGFCKLQIKSPPYIELIVL